MKINYWNPLIIVLGIVALGGMLCILIFSLRKLELVHQENMTDKEIARDILSQSRTSPQRLFSPWQFIKLFVRKVAAEICPTFIIKWLGV